MTEQRQLVFGEETATNRVPGWANDGAFAVEWLQQHGLWEHAAHLFKVQREGGYAGIDALLFLVYYFASGLQEGLKKFSDRARPHHLKLAAVGGRRRLATQASISRLLSAVESEHVSTFGDWLLRDAPGIASVLQHASVRTRDAQGTGWHVFDWDPTVTALRHRALPTFEDMPDGRRRSADCANPGYSGRKRGDVQFSRATLQHSGSGLWLGIDIAPGNGELRNAFHRAIGQVVATCEHADLELGRAMIRADGVAGNVPFITACEEANLTYITRLAHYQLLADDNVVEHLNEAEWFEVPSSGSGPTRQATDLGRVVLEPSRTTSRSDGGDFEPIETRVVVSRFAVDGEGRGAGVVLDGWQYELYATSAGASAWPAEEVVTGYYARGALENRFLQEDHELGLDRIFSYHLPGQCLATLVGLFIWNFAICRGMELESPPETLPEQPQRDSSPIEEKPELRAGASVAEDVDTESLHNGESTGVDAEGELHHKEGELHHEPVDSATSRRDVIGALDIIDWADMLAEHEEWQWESQYGCLRCPAGAFLPLKRIEDVRGKPIRVRFKAESGTCDNCPLRDSCFQSADPHYRKDIRLPLPAPHAEPLRALWESIPREERRASGNGQPKRAIWRLKPLTWQPPKPCAKSPSFVIWPPALLPAVLRRSTRASMRGFETHIVVCLPEVEDERSRALAYSPAERQNRRLTWAERLRWNALPEDAHVTVRLLGAQSVRPLLRPRDRLGNTPA